jgi:hypothetical protein
MLKATRVLAVGILTAVLTATVGADHSWETYHWARTANPFTLQIGDNVSGVWDSHLDVAIQDWNASSVLALTEVAGGAGKQRNCRPTTGRIEVCNSTYGSNGWLGIAQIWISGGHITQATTKLNDTYFKTATYDKPEWRQLVMCQEVGHDFGLDHQDENFGNVNLGTCMDYTSSPLSNQHPNAHDYGQLESIYAHLDTYTTAGAAKLPSLMPPAMGQIDFETPAQWGRQVHRSANGRQAIYELDFGRRHRVVTHVFWADPDADEHAH